MAIKALEKGGKFDILSNVEILHIEELKKTDEQKALDYERSEATRYYLRVPNSDEMATITNLMQPVRGNGTYTFPRIGEARAYATLCCLVGWDNINNSDDGTPIAFKGRKGDDGRLIGSSVDDMAILPSSEKECILDAVINACNVAMRDFR